MLYLVLLILAYGIVEGIREGFRRSKADDEQRKREGLLSRGGQSGTRSEWFEQYGQYLKSPEWRARRESRLMSDGYVCQCCGGPATEVHHLSYERVGDESADDLASVCHTCHERLHGRNF
jgi:hypothetical protein